VDTIALRAALARLATNQRWTWRHHLTSVFDRLPTADPDRHPVVRVRMLEEWQLEQLLHDRALVDTVVAELASLDAELATAVTDPQVTYYSPEFGISELVPQYSGGLGVLAGDHMKAASDLATQIGGVGLFYREGFFRQELRDGHQAERYEDYPPEDLGLSDTGIMVEVPFPGRTVHARVWRFCVGRITLLLLDTDTPLNSPHDRLITDRLYSGEPYHRLEQEMVLGVGGCRAVRAFGWTPAVRHLNEGHAGFLVFELIDRAMANGAGSIEAAVDQIRPHVMFTTHTPVPAGIDRFHRSLIEPYLGSWAQRWGVDVESIMRLGLDPDAGTEMFNMAALALGVAARANGVSKLHGEVSRELFGAVPGGDRIGSVTNGVHARTWVHPVRQDLFDAELGAGWDLGDAEAWAKAAHLDGDQILAARDTGRQALAAMLEARTGQVLHPDALVIGFARRFATYKRATLLLRHADRLAALLADEDRPVQFMFAGKAHPADQPGKSVLADVVAFSGTPAANGRFTLIPDYDIRVARALYAGSDVWLNTPVRPHEASGTSGEKAALNGAVNCSILDGWWAEMSDGRNGIDIPTSDLTDPWERDGEESAAALDAIDTILAEFHADGRGRPSAAWLDRVRHVWISLGPKVTAARMVSDYDREFYQPMIEAVHGEHWRG
jgi:starch phosphorylase